MYNKYEKCQPSGFDVIPTCLFYGDAFKLHKLASADVLETIRYCDRVTDGERMGMPTDC